MTTDVSDTAQAMQRIKVGATGLAAVLLIILLASAVLSWASKEKPVAVAGAAKPEVVANMTQTNASYAADARAKEPLAELGVAPSATPDAPNASAPVPQHGRR